MCAAMQRIEVHKMSLIAQVARTAVLDRLRAVNIPIHVQAEFTVKGAPQHLTFKINAARAFIVLLLLLSRSRPVHAVLLKQHVLLVLELLKIASQN